MTAFQPKFLKFANTVVLQPVTYVINETIKMSEFPDECKKQWSARFINRPVEYLTYLSKLPERAMNA